MNYQDIQNGVQTRFNRRDVTTSQIQSWIITSIQRAQRLLGTRVPANENVLLYTVPSDGTFQGYIQIPGDYLSMVSITVDGGDPLDLAALKTTQRAAFMTQGVGLAPAPLNGFPKFYSRDQANFLIGPQPSGGSIVRITYNADFTGLVNPTDTNWMTVIAPDVIIYGALSDAAVVYTDPRKDTFEERFTKGIVDLINQASDEALRNAVVAPASSLNDGNSDYGEW